MALPSLQIKSYRSPSHINYLPPIIKKPSIVPRYKTPRRNGSSWYYHPLISYLSSPPHFISSTSSNAEERNLTLPGSYIDPSSLFCLRHTHPKQSYQRRFFLQLLEHHPIPPPFFFLFHNFLKAKGKGMHISVILNSVGFLGGLYMIIYLTP